MVYCEEHPDQSSAQKAEHAFKKLTRKQKENQIEILEKKIAKLRSTNEEGKRVS
jgi:predicted GIY-YIG superfamily endonuclease